MGRTVSAASLFALFCRRPSSPAAFALQHVSASTVSPACTYTAPAVARHGSARSPLSMRYTGADSEHRGRDSDTPCPATEMAFGAWPSPARRASRSRNLQVERDLNCSDWTFRCCCTADGGYRGLDAPLDWRILTTHSQSIAARSPCRGCAASRFVACSACLRRRRDGILALPTYSSRTAPGCLGN